MGQIADEKCIYSQQFIDHSHYLEAILFCDRKNAEETFPTPKSLFLILFLTTQYLVRFSRILKINDTLSAQPEVVVSDGGIILLSRSVQDVNLNFFTVKDHLCICICFPFCICIYFQIGVQNVYLDFFPVQ